MNNEDIQNKLNELVMQTALNSATFENVGITGESQFGWLVKFTRDVWFIEYILDGEYKGQYQVISGNREFISRSLVWAIERIWMEHLDSEEKMEYVNEVIIPMLMK